MLHDRGLIAPRSRFDRIAIVEFFHEVSGSSDEASSKWTIAISRSIAPNRKVSPPLDGDRLMKIVRQVIPMRLMKIGRCRRFHVAKGKTRQLS